MRLQVRSLVLLSGLRVPVAVSCGVGCRHGSDLVLLWLWRGPAAVAPIPPLAWESPYAVGTALKSKKKKKEDIEYTSLCYIVGLFLPILYVVVYIC